MAALALPLDEYHRAPPEASAPAWTSTSDPPYTRRMSPPDSTAPRAPDRSDFAAALGELLDLVRHLSGPDGCPWDREQTLRTLSPYAVEEAHEIADAIAAGDRPAIAEEVGDLLFLVTFLAVRLEQEGGPAPAAIARANVAKMIARHPHVFSERKDLDAQGVLRQWEEGKRGETGEQGKTGGKTGGESLLGKSPAGLPALLRAYRVQEKAAAVGFDWDDVGGVLAKVREELAEVEAEIKGGRDGEVEEEIGDLLFAVVNLARFVKTDPEAHLRAATEKFRGRFDRVTAMLKAEGRSPESAGLPELDRLWEAAKLEEGET
jgi:ATP diphosphatase